MLNLADVQATLLQTLTHEGLRPNTVRQVRYSLQRFAEWLAQEHLADLRHLTAADLQRYALHVQRQPLSPAAQALRLRGVRRLFGFLVAQQQLLLDPSLGLPQLRRQQSLPRAVLTQAEAKRLRQAPDVSTPLGLRDRAVLEVLYATALRIGELVQLQLTDVDLNQQTVTVRQGKSHEPRVVPLGQVACTWLLRYLREARPILQARSRSGSETALFLGRLGQALTTFTARDRVRQLARAASINKPVSPHCLRHSCATHLLQQGADIRVIQQLLGHRKLDSTVAYTRVLPLEVQASHRRCHPSEGCTS